MNIVSRVYKKALFTGRLRFFMIVVCLVSMSLISIFLLEPINGYLKVSSLMHNDAAGAAENQYCIMEENLRIRLQNYETLYPNYNEYYYELDEITHDSYVLISMLCAIHGDDFSFADAQFTLNELFEEQYVISEEVHKKRRYVKGVEVDYYICTVRLENNDLIQIANNLMDTEQLSVYKTYLSYFERIK